MINLMYGDCLDKMSLIPDNSVDLVLTDPPYGTTACKWDSIIPLDEMWIQLNRLLTKNGTVIFTSSQPFTTRLISSNYDMFKYCLVWEKNRASGHLHAKNKPLKAHEDIVIFSKGTTIHALQSDNRMCYNPIFTKGTGYKRVETKNKTGSISHVESKVNIDFVGSLSINNGTRYPRSVMVYNNHNVGNFHPTQKPVKLMEYLIKTYSNENDTVLDFTMGSGTTGVACRNLKRSFIGIELDKNYFNIASKRINKPRLTDFKI